jgi:hypothetical protein
VEDITLHLHHTTPHHTFMSQTHTHTHVPISTDSCVCVCPVSSSTLGVCCVCCGEGRVAREDGWSVFASVCVCVQVCVHVKMNDHIKQRTIAHAHSSTNHINTHTHSQTHTYPLPSQREPVHPDQASTHLCVCVCHYQQHPPRTLVAFQKQSGARHRPFLWHRLCVRVCVCVWKKKCVW